MAETSWDKAYKLSEGNEGGISTDRDDTGNFYEVAGKNNFVATRYGQTFVNWLGSSKKKKPTTQAEFDSLKEEFEKVTVDDVKKSFKNQYWNKYNLDKIKDDKVAANIYDAMINQEYTLGGKGTHATLADVLNELGYDVDGATDFGTNKKAIDALNKAIDEKGAKAVNTAYSNRREESYMGSGTVSKHGKGWLKRLNLYREPEDQYSKEQFDEMQFSNDSTSNLNVLKEIKSSGEPKKETSQSDDLNISPEDETKIEKYIRLRRKAAKNQKHDLTTGPSPFELTNEEQQFLVDVDDKGSPDYISQKERITSDADLLIASDGDSSIIDAAKLDALKEASEAATGLSEVVTDPVTGETEVASIPEGTTGKTKESIELEEDKRRIEADLKKAEEARIRAEEADYIKKVKEGTATQEERDAALKRHNDRVASLMEEYKTEEEEEEGGDGLTTQQQKDALRAKRMQQAEKVLSGLKAAAGVLSLSKALKDPEVDTPEISPLLMEAVNKQRQMATSGLTAQEKSAAMQGLDNAYAGAMKNVLRASGGQRGMFLAGQGVVDANRIQGLNQLAAQDAALHRQNIQQYNQLASSVGQMKLQADTSAEQMKQSALAQNRKTLAGIGTNLVSDALSDLSWYMNPNKDLVEQATRDALENITGNSDGKYDPNADYDVKGGNFRKEKE